MEGYYFITMCTTGRTLRFGELRNEMMVLNKAGKAVESTWRDLPIHYPNLQLDEFFTMPNHFHAIAILEGQGHNLSEIVRGFKTWSSRRVNKILNSAGTPLWQRSFYDPVIRDERDLHSIREYIANNPLQWELDHENPKNL